jgi:PST family polysaccharide transporter
MKLILKNIFSSALVQGINLLVPLILTPVLIVRVGLDQFGIFAASTALAAFFMLFTDFGINVTAVRRIVSLKKNTAALNSVLSNIFFLKLLLTGIIFIIYLVAIFIIPVFRQYFLIHLFSFTLVLAHAFMTSWYYQAFENISRTVIPSVIIRCISLLLVLLFVKSPEDTMYVNLILGGGNILIAVVLFAGIRKNHALAFKLPGRFSIKQELETNFAIFISNIGTALYANVSVIILSFFVAPAMVGIYSVAEKIIQLLKGFLALIHYSSYPEICKITEARQPVMAFIKRFYLPIWIITFSTGVALYLVPELFTTYFIKDAFRRATADVILQKMSFLIFIVSVNMPFFQTLLAMKRDWLIVKIVITTATLSLAVNLSLQFFIPVNGTIFSMYIAEIAVTVLYWHFATRLFCHSHPKENLL